MLAVSMTVESDTPVASVRPRLPRTPSGARGLGPRRTVLALALALGLGAPARAQTQGEALELKRPRWTREQMEATIGAGERWLFVYGTLDPAQTPLLRERALAVARRLFPRDSGGVVPDRSPILPLARERSLVLFGGPRANLWTARLAAALPLQFAAHGFHFGDRDYDRPGDAIQLVYPNPLEPRHLLILFAGNSPAALAGRGFWIGAEDWRVTRDGELARSGSFAQSATGPWRYDPRLDRDRERERERYAASLVATPGRALIVRSPGPLADAAGVLTAGDALIARMKQMGLAPPKSGRITLELYPSLESKATYTRSTRPEQVDDQGVAHAALPSGHARYDLWSVAGAALEASGGSLDSRFLVPASVWLAERYGGESLARATGRLYFGHLLPTAREAATTDTLWRSPLVWVPARALLAASVYQCAGRGAARALGRLLARDPPASFDSLCARAGVDPARVERFYLDLADSLARRSAHESDPHPAPRAWRPGDGFQRGVCFAHAVSLERGYASASAGRELEALKRMGANWVSITPFGYLPAPDVPVLYPSAQGGPEEENDESVCEAAARAKALGLRVWLKPHLWTRGWVGELHFTAAGWNQFFEQYRRVALHYALLAQREGMDGFVIGHELPTATLAFPDRWRRLIGEVRRVYEGTLTYGANWNREVESIPFWDALDVIGVSYYVPFTDEPTRSAAVLEAGARKSLEPLRAVAVRARKPVVLVELGYPATAAAAVRPWDEDHGALDLEAQRACYDAMVRALEPETWIAGVFWWKWSSAEDSGGAHDPSFTPRGKPAQQVMARAFGEWEGRPVYVPPK